MLSKVHCSQSLAATRSIEFGGNATTKTVMRGRARLGVRQQVNVVMISAAKQQPPWPPLVGIYCLTTMLCAFMVVWILIFPSSVLVEHSSFHRHAIASLMGHAGSFMAPDLVTKYQGYYLVQSLHILPGALWALLIPIQLHSQVRKRYRVTHRILGYVFGVISTLIGVSVAIIYWQELSFEHYYPDLKPFPGSSAPGILLLALYFVGTMACSVYQAAVRHDFHCHRKWMVRHIAAGLWTSVQRIMLTIGLILPPLSSEGQRFAFPFTFLVALGIAMFVGERTVHLLNQQQVRKGDKCNN
jgi:Predicted membrane protein (DUF2306)